MPYQIPILIVLQNLEICGCENILPHIVIKCKPIAPILRNTSLSCVCCYLIFVIFGVNIKQYSIYELSTNKSLLIEYIKIATYNCTDEEHTLWTMRNSLFITLNDEWSQIEERMLPLRECNSVS